HLVHGVDLRVRATEHAAVHGVMLGERRHFEEPFPAALSTRAGAGHAAASCIIVSDSQQATRCPASFSSSGGYSLRQRAVAAAQRGAKAQPMMGSASDGTMPAISVRRTAPRLPPESFGMESRRPRV